MEDPSRARFRIPIVKHKQARFLRISCSWRSCRIGDVQVYLESDLDSAPPDPEADPRARR